MPRGPRLDAPGTLHHLIVRGIERRVIVDDDKDHEDFVTRMGAVALKLINEYGVSLAETARRLGISTSGVAQILRLSMRS